MVAIPAISFDNGFDFAGQMGTPNIIAKSFYPGRVAGVKNIFEKLYYVQYYYLFLL